MPLILTVAGPLAGTLPMPKTWAEEFAEVPGFVGAWDAAVLAPGAVASWPATFGTDTLAQSIAARRPGRTTQGGVATVQGALGAGLYSSAAFTSGAPLTVAMRVYLSDLVQDIQYLFGAGGWRVMYRSTAGSKRFAFDGTTDVEILATGAGWYNVIAAQSDTTTTLDINGTVMTAANAGAPITSVNILNSAAQPSSGGFLGHVSKLAIAKAGLAGTPQLDTFRAWLG